MAKFPSEEWVAEFKNQINANPAYREAAKTWEGDFYFIVEPEGGLKERVYMYLDLWHGECRDAFIAKDPLMKQPQYEISGPPSVWKKIIEKKLDSMQALLTRQLKLKGDMGPIMKAVKAAQELVNSATRVPTEFPV
jgi:putative sterol carrier protein